MTKAQFRAMREQAGYSQQALADALSVNVRTVKRWEHEGYDGEAPGDAWELLSSALDVQREMALYALDTVKSVEREAGRNAACVPITYYRDQAMYDQSGREEGYFGVANANARAAAELLTREGRRVEFRYPPEGAIRTPGSRY